MYIYRYRYRYIHIYMYVYVCVYILINYLCKRDKALSKKNNENIFVSFLFGRTTVDVAGVTNAVARGVAIGYSDLSVCVSLCGCVSVEIALVSLCVLCVCVACVAVCSNS